MRIPFGTGKAMFSFVLHPEKGSVRAFCRHAETLLQDGIIIRADME